jgi:hypothetical protein
MIVCTSCGARNSDDARACAVCGRKLQSGWAIGGNGESDRAAGKPEGPADAAPANAAPANAAPANAVPAGGASSGGLDLDEMGRRSVARENAHRATIDAGLAGGAWEQLAPVERTPDPAANRLVRVCAETWLYAFVLVGGAAVTVVVEDWRYLALSLVVAAGLAWLRGIR